MRRRAFIGVVLFGLGLAWAAPLSAAPSSKEVERRAATLERLLVAPCCYKGTLADHASALAEQMRKEIRAQIRAGRTNQEILNYYKNKYGQAVLAEPPKGGLSTLVLYGIPFGLAVIGLLVTTLLIARRRPDDHLAESQVIPPDHRLPPEMEARIDRLVRPSSDTPS